MGRHREFDADAALDSAVELFWRRGYEGASMAELVAATGVAAPGLYAAFGNKQALFLAAVERYETQRMGFMQEALRQPTARAVVEHLLHHNARLLAGGPGPAGCLGINGALAVSAGAEPVREELVRRRSVNEAVLRQRFDQARADGDLPAALEPEELARYIMTLVQGMAVQAKAGASLAQLERVSALALRIWP